MRFCLIDQVLEVSEDRLVAVKNITSCEEYLQDHFPSFPVLPGVLMIEALIQASRRLLAQTNPAGRRFVLGGVRALKYGNFVRPGDALRVEVEIVSRGEDGSVTLKGSGRAIRPETMGNGNGGSDGPMSVAGRFVMRPVRLASA